MRKRYLRSYCKMPMNLQFFAEGDEGGTGGEGGAGVTGDEGGAGGTGGNNQMSFEEFLGQDGNQEEFDRRVQEAVNTAVTKAQEKWQALTDDKLSEAEKLAKMTKDEKAEYLTKKKEKELADREAAITKKELMAEAKNTLSEKQLPVDLADVLNYADADSCNKSIDLVEKAFKRAVEAAVNERLKGGDALKKPTGDENSKSDEIYNLMMGNK